MPPLLTKGDFTVQYQKPFYRGAARVNAAGMMPPCACPDRPEESADCAPLVGKSLAMVYAPCQTFDQLYEPCEGLAHGTIFIELDKPFFGAGRMA